MALSLSGYPLGWLALGAPAFMTLLLTRVSGIPRLVEEHMLRKHGAAFAAYQARTSAFIPCRPVLRKVDCMSLVAGLIAWGERTPVPDVLTRAMIAWLVGRGPTGTSRPRARLTTRPSRRPWTLFPWRSIPTPPMPSTTRCRRPSFSRRWAEAEVLVLLL